MRSFIALSCLLLLAPISQAGDPPPSIGIVAVRQAIEGRRVMCYALQPTTTLMTALTVTLAYGGTAVKNTDYTAPTTVTLPIGLDSSHAIFIPIVAVTDNDASGEIIVCTIQESTAYEIFPSLASASITVLSAFSDSVVAAAGEPNAISVEANTPWTYDLHVQRPSQVPGTVPDIPVQPFLVVLEDNAPAWLTVTRLPVTGSDTVPFRISGTPPTGGIQVRFRLGIQVDVDGDQHFVPSGAPTTTGQPSSDAFNFQDIVLAVRLAGAG